ncbi:hypothetical protein Q9L58_004076 [Maublancomyces gigas]|uniref:tyrosinase n=1 Tax=Discina gigas TaxID=1032678 RepID=A0ABR3GM18_9PEZI
MAEAQIDIKIPEQDLVNTVQIANPLLSYDFPGVDRPMNLGGPRTTRFQANLIVNMLQADGLRAQLYDALTLEAEYGPFSNNGQQGTSSLENSHDLVHDSVGDYLRTPIAAAFDPIFWLIPSACCAATNIRPSSHSSIDRFYAMWQVRNPDAIFQGNPNQPADTILTPLAPFTTQNQGALWTSAMIQRSNIPNMAIPTTYMLGYDYPETLAAWPAVQRTQAVNDTIVGLYAPPPQPPGGPPPAGPPPDAGQILGQEQFPQGVIPVLLGHGVPPDLPIFAGYRREWRLWIEVKRNLVVPNFNIYALLGNTSPAADSDWTTGSDVAGAFVISKSPITMCQNCRDTENNLLYGGIILTDPLLYHLPNEIKLGDQTQVVEWLQKHLHWRIQAHDGTEVELTEDLSEFEPGCHKLLIGLESYETAYAPVDNDGRPTCDVSKILGVTWDKKDHTEVTSPMASRGGAARRRSEYDPSTTVPTGTEVVE